jgi:hypothetical protein
MAIRRLVATATPQRLPHGQVQEFFAKYILPYGPPLGGWYFTIPGVAPCPAQIRHAERYIGGGSHNYAVVRRKRIARSTVRVTMRPRFPTLG